MIERFTSYIGSIVIEYGAVGVFLSTLLQEIIAPIPSPLVPLMAGFFLLPVDGVFLEIIWKTVFVIALPVSLGITLGSLVVYGLGYIGGKIAVEKSKKWIGLSWKDLERIKNKLTSGSGDEVALFILRALPIVPGVAISGFCGMVRYPFKTFVTVTFFGAFSRALVLGIVGWSVGGVYAVYSGMISRIENYILITFIIFVLFFFGRLYFLKKSAKKKEYQEARKRD